MVKKYPIVKLLFNKEIINETQRDLIMAKTEEIADEMDAIVGSEVLSEKELTKHLGVLFNMEYIDLEGYEIDDELIEVIPKNILTKLLVLPIKEDETTISIVVSDPTDIQGLESLYYYTDKKIIFFISEKSIIEKRYLVENSKSSSSEAIETLSIEFGEADIISENNVLSDDSDAPSIKLTNSILSEAITMGASDIHIEPFETHLLVRYRLDGILKEILRLPANIYPAIIARFKMMSGMDISERRIPQEGRLEVTLIGKAVDLRFSSLPNVFGEKIVIRILQKDIMDKSLKTIGFSDEDYVKVQEMLGRRDGIILVTGPTGSGKSTTLYSFLNEMRSSEKAIVTVEDPVEYTIDGFNQTQVNTKQGMTFPLALRAILRQDPDIIMIGEIRDEETANIAVRSSITGHLVFSTLHTNSALSSIIRLVDMGVRPYLLADSIRGVIAQRLVRRLCPDCKEAYISTPHEMIDLNITEPTTLYKACGCKRCNQIGYKGRFPVFEVLRISKELKKLIQNEAPADELDAQVKTERMQLLYDRGVQAVLNGQTSIQELRGLDNGDTTSAEI
ncbi:MAG: GspE/PulE family protein [Bacilli bacterium]